VHIVQTGDHISTSTSEPSEASGRERVINSGEHSTETKHSIDFDKTETNANS
jgi:hypothetical protein